MNHDRECRVVKLRNLALLLERGELRREMEIADLLLDDGQHLRVIGAIRRLADAIEETR